MKFLRVSECVRCHSNKGIDIIPRLHRSRGFACGCRECINATSAFPSMHLLTSSCRLHYVAARRGRLHFMASRIRASPFNILKVMSFVGLERGGLGCQSMYVMKLVAWVSHAWRCSRIGICAEFIFWRIVALVAWKRV